MGFDNLLVVHAELLQLIHDLDLLILGEEDANADVEALVVGIGERASPDAIDVERGVAVEIGHDIVDQSRELLVLLIESALIGEIDRASQIDALDENCGVEVLVRMRDLLASLFFAVAEVVGRSIDALLVKFGQNIGEHLSRILLIFDQHEALIVFLLIARQLLLLVGERAVGLLGCSRRVLGLGLGRLGRNRLGCRLLRLLGVGRLLLLGGRDGRLVLGRLDGRLSLDRLLLLDLFLDDILLNEFALLLSQLVRSHVLGSGLVEAARDRNVILLRNRLQRRMHLLRHRERRLHARVNCIGLHHHRHRESSHQQTELLIHEIDATIDFLELVLVLTFEKRLLGVQLLDVKLKLLHLLLKRVHVER